MKRESDQLTPLLLRLDQALVDLAAKLAVSAGRRIDAWRMDADALRFHLTDMPGHPVTVVVGGTGTGKSTLVNRLVGHTVTAASFRRTFTSGPVAVVGAASDLPDKWLGVEHIPAAADQPPRGQNGAVMVVVDSLTPTTIVDTPDLDGDQPANHAQADRAFRWANRVIFVVTPEKYQMTELIPYYRLARRYDLPSLFVMNKCEEPAVLTDFLHQLADRDFADAHCYSIPRDDAGYEPPADENIDALRDQLKIPVAISTKSTGIRNRTTDLVTRLNDQVIGPLRDARRLADRLCSALHAMETPPLGVDVNPITDELRRRLQQRSVLYLVGPQRVLDRVRQVPTLLARLPRATWDWVMRGQIPSDLNHPRSTSNPTEPPDFTAVLSDQFTVVRSRVDDVVRSDALASKWIDEDPDAYRGAMIDSSSAGLIAADEVQQLRDWLEKRWNATPRDTRIVQAILKYVPGAAKLTRLSEVAPYLLVAALVAAHAVFWHIDLPVIGGYTLVTWLTEKISNEVNARTRGTNRKISDRFENLAHDQIEKLCQWIDRHAPSIKELDRLEKLANELAEACG